MPSEERQGRGKGTRGGGEILKRDPPARSPECEKQHTKYALPCDKVLGSTAQLSFLCDNTTTHVRASCSIQGEMIAYHESSTRPPGAPRTCSKRRAHGRRNVRCRAAHGRRKYPMDSRWTCSEMILSDTVYLPAIQLRGLGSSHSNPPAPRRSLPPDAPYSPLCGVLTVHVTLKCTNISSLVHAEAGNEVDCHDRPAREPLRRRHRIPPSIAVRNA